MNWLFGEDTPLAVRFGLLIAMIVVALILISIVVRIAVPRRQRATPRTSISGTWSIRRAIIVTAETIAMIQVLLLTIVGAIFGVLSAQLLTTFIPNTADSTVFLFMLVGAAFGFLTAVIWLGFVYLLSEIERNTRHTAAMLERIVNRGREAGE